MLLISNLPMCLAFDYDMLPYGNALWSCQLCQLP